MDEKHALAVAVYTVTWDPRRKRWVIRGTSRGERPIVVDADTSMDWDVAAFRLLAARMAATLESMLPFLSGS